MPFSVQIEHSIRVVHPGIFRRMMVCRAVFFLVFLAEIVGEFHLAPADFAFRIPPVGPVNEKVNQKFYILILPFLQIKGYVIVHRVKSKADIYGSLKGIPAYYFHARFGSLLLYREEKVSGLL